MRFFGRRLYHNSVAGRALSKYYKRNHLTRMRAEFIHLVKRMRLEVYMPDDFTDLAKDLAWLRARMSGYARRRGFSGTKNSHYYAWLYTPEERRKQNLACGYNCTMDMDTYRKLSKKHGYRVHL